MIHCVMELLILRDGHRHVGRQPELYDCHVRQRARPERRVTSSSLDMSQNNSRTMFAQPGTSSAVKIEKETLMTIFRSEIRRVRWVIRHQGEYDQKSLIDNTGLLTIGRETCRSRTSGPPQMEMAAMGAPISLVCANVFPVSGRHDLSAFVCLTFLVQTYNVQPSSAAGATPGFWFQLISHGPETWLWRSHFHLCPIRPGSHTVGHRSA
jgi:hypothetical protein